MNLAKIAQRAASLKNRFTYQIAQNPDTNESFGFIGSDTNKIRYARIWLEATDHLASARKCRFASMEHSCEALAKNHGIAIISNLRVSQELAEKTLQAPSFLEMTMPVPKDIEEYKKQLFKTNRGNIQRIKNKNFEFEISKSPKDFEIFYHQYYRTTNKEKYQREGIYWNAETATQYFLDNNSEFMKVYRNGEWIAGGISRFSNLKYSILACGVKDGNPNFIREGAIAARFLFCVSRAQTLNLKEFSFGGAPPFLNDGLFRYKANWGLRPNPKDSLGTNYFFINPKHKNCKALLHRQPLLFIEGGNVSILALNEESIRNIKGLPKDLVPALKNRYVLESSNSKTATRNATTLPEHMQPFFSKLL